MFVNELHVMLINGNESLDSDQKYVKFNSWNHIRLLVNLSGIPVMD